MSKFANIGSGGDPKEAYTTTPAGLSKILMDQYETLKSELVQTD
jgi:hypothetical protein